MVAHLIRLKLLLLRNGLRRSPWQLVGIVVGGLYGLWMLFLAVVGLILLRTLPTDVAETVLVLGGTLLLLGWTLTPVIFAGIDLTLEPARFALFPIPLRQLLLGQAVAGLIGVPGVCTLLALAATTVTWARGPLPFAIAVVSAVLALGLCVVLSRLVASAASELATSRRFRDVSRILLIVPLVLLGPGISLLAQGIGDSGAPGISAAAAVLGWTPLGAPFSAPAEAADGQLPVAVAKLIIAAAGLGLAAWGWSRTLSRALESPGSRSGSRSGGRGRGLSRAEGRGLGAFRWMPPTPAGAVAARALTYWIRDPRYTAGLIVVPLLPVIMYVSTVTGRRGHGSLLEGPFAFSGVLAAFILAWSISADVSYDSTAFSLHVAAGVRGRSDRLGRAAALLLFAFPTIVVLTLLPFLLAGDWSLAPAFLGLSLGVLLSGVGLSSLVSARYTVVVPLPGESPFKRPAGNSAQTLLVQFGGTLALGILASPEIVLLVLALVTRSPGYAWGALGVGVALGTGLLIAGILLGGLTMDRRAPELYASLTRVR
ncbi:transporter [Sinomonas cellulolyticus]|uniref:Transporter n=1 Tax=Sinomonas cellulolyticus TaxID=2801916 RepID=A0ABS1K852_9MICC|nr:MULTISPECIES: transporter [Sinomonas]MBL0706496.1 transporter [Sinomonas cellulolyticus]GHG44941.1 transporter [Sinomonas sp. KCTC 49339]